MFGIEDVAKSSTDEVIGRKFIYGIVSNPIYTALIITVLMMVIITYGDKSPWSKKFKVGFWMFILNLGIIWLHDKVLIDETSAVEKQADVSETLSNLNDVNIFDSSAANQI